MWNKFLREIQFCLLLNCLIKAFIIQAMHVIDDDCSCRGNPENSTMAHSNCNGTDTLIITGMSLECRQQPHTVLAQISNKNLKRLDWHDTHLSVLHNDSLTGIVHTEYLNVSGNAIANVDVDAFRKLLRLLVLDLSHNRIVSLPSTVFFSNTLLLNTSLVHNRLTVLDLSMNTKSMWQLDVSQNSLISVNLKAAVTSQRRNLTSIILDYNCLDNFNVSNAFQTDHVSLRHNNITDLQFIGRLNLWSIERIDLEHNRINNLNNLVASFRSKLNDIRLAHNELDTINTTSLLRLFPRLKYISVAFQKEIWLCSDLRRTLIELKAANVEVLDMVRPCFDPKKEIHKLHMTFMRKYTNLVLIFGVTTLLLTTTILILGIAVHRSLRRKRADSISKSFDIKIMPPPPPPLPPENIYEENVYNHVYSDPTPTTTL